MKYLIWLVFFVTGCTMVPPHGCTIGYKVGPESGCYEDHDAKDKK